MRSHHSPLVVGIAGPSCAGKSMAVRAIADTFECAVVPLDHFFCKNAPETTLGFKNWEIREAIMFDRLADTLRDLRRKKSVMIPREPWTEDFSLVIRPADLVIAEGFLLFLDKGVVDLLDLRIFIDLPEDSQLARRMQRDTGLDSRYIEQVVIPAFRRHRPLLLAESDTVIDGGRAPEVVAGELKRVIERVLRK